MKLLKVLSSRPVTALNEYEFRNANDVTKLLQSIEKENEDAMKLLEKFTAAVEASDDDDEPRARKFGIGKDTKPGIVKLKSVPGARPAFRTAELNKLGDSFDLLQNLLERMEVLESLDVRIRTAFEGSKKLKAMQEEIKVQKTSTQNALTKAKLFIESIADKHLPDSVNKIFNEVANPVLRGLKGKYKKKLETLQVNTMRDGKGSVIQFTKYINLTELKNDKGFVYHTFFIVLTCTINGKGDHVYYVDTQMKFEPPSTAPLNDNSRGFQFTKSRDGMRLLQMHLKADEDLNILAPDHLPIDIGQLKNLGGRVSNFIKSVSIDEDEKTIRVILNKDVPEIQITKNIVPTILADIGGLTRTSTLSEKLKYKLGKTTTGHRTLTIWFTLPTPRAGKEYRDNMTALRQIKEHLNLKDGELKKIGRILRSRNVEE